MAALLPCASSSVSTESELNKAIVTFNDETHSCYHIITLVADIALTQSTIPISNASARLVIDGAGFSVDGQGIKGVRPFEIGAGTVVYMKNITITGGVAKGVTTIEDSGGGIYNRGTLTLADSTITGNRAPYSGGGLNNRGALNLISSTLSDNLAGYFGGGVRSWEGSLTVTGCIITGNQATHQAGGGIYSSGLLTIKKSTISNNVTDGSGGGIHCGGIGTNIITDSTIADNTVANSRGDRNNGGAGIMNYSNLIITNSTISGNKATNGIAGGIYHCNEELILTNSTIYRNSAGVAGSGLYTSCGTLRFNNSIIAGKDGRDCTGIFYEAFASHTLISSTGVDACNVIGGVDGNIVGVDPLLGKLADNGGLTKTHALLLKSPARDAGDNDLAVDPDGDALDFDQRGEGYDRFLGARDRVDIGAYELDMESTNPFDRQWVH